MTDFIQSPINEIIIRANPAYILGDAPTYIGRCPLHKDYNEYLQFELADGRVKLFCHSCHYDGKRAKDIMRRWNLDEEHLYVGREMNPQEYEYIISKANLMRLSLESTRLHGLEWNENVRQQYLKIINEKLPWVKRLEEYYRARDEEVQDLPF